MVLVDQHGGVAGALHQVPDGLTEVEGGTDDADQLAVAVHAAVGDQRVKDLAAASPHREAARPGTAFPQRSHDLRRRLPGDRRHRHVRDVTPHRLLGGPAVQLLGGTVPEQHRALRVRGDHGVTEGVQQLVGRGTCGGAAGSPWIQPAPDVSRGHGSKDPDRTSCPAASAPVTSAPDPTRFLVRAWGCPARSWPTDPDMPVAPLPEGGGVPGEVMVDEVVGCRAARVARPGRARWCRCGRVGSGGRGVRSTRRRRGGHPVAPGGVGLEAVVEPAQVARLAVCVGPGWGLPSAWRRGRTRRRGRCRSRGPGGCTTGTRTSGRGGSPAPGSGPGPRTPGSMRSALRSMTGLIVTLVRESPHQRVDLVE